MKLLINAVLMPGQPYLHQLLRFKTVSELNMLKLLAIALDSSTYFSWEFSLRNNLRNIPRAC